MLVDQKFRHGIRTQFFGRDCETSPLVPKLARQYECDVYPAHSIRLPGNRFRLVLEERLELPRDGEGLVDVEASAQLLNDVVERWVRERPRPVDVVPQTLENHAAAAGPAKIPLTSRRSSSSRRAAPRRRTASAR